MKRFLLAIVLCAFGILQSQANYTGSLPYTVSSNKFTVDGYTFSIADGYYQEWDHYVIFWSTGYGSKTNATTIGSGDYLLNLTQMKQYAELCYTNYTSVGFLDPTSSDGGGHKIIILAYYSTDWFATGSGVSTSSGIWGVLNISHSSANPSATNPYYTYCHEIGHAYQYLGYAKNGGNAGFNYESGMYGWVSYYECCGNWQAALEYPALYFPQSMSLYMKTTNLAFTHAWHCYQSYPLNDYLTEKCGQTTIGDIWTINTNVSYAEPLEKYMSKTGCTAEELYRQLFFAAMRMTTWDLTRWDSYLTSQGVSRDKYMDHRMGTQACTTTATTTPQTYSDSYYPTQSTYQYVTTNSSSAIHQVAYSSAPQSSGFNCIKLNVPSGTSRTVTTTFTALAPGASLASGDKKEYWMGSMWAKSSSQSTYNTGVTAQSNSTYNTYKTWRGFRLGYVAYKKSGEVRYYNYTDKVYCTGTSETSASLSFDVPDDVDSLYFVVSPALSNYLRNESSGSYDISGSSASEYVSFQQTFDQWPYRVQFYNTNIYGLTNPSTSFSGTADSGTTWTTMPDLSDGEEYGATETTYTIKTATGSPSGAGFTVSSSLTSAGNNQYTTRATITSDNATSYITPTSVEGYRASISVSGTTITITYTAVPSTTYTISVASGSPTGAGFTVTNSALTLVSGSSYKTYDEITSSNVGSYVSATAVDGYTSSITLSGTTITITYTEKPSQLTIQRNLSFPTTTDYSGTSYTLSSSDLTAITDALGCTTTQLENSSNWETADSYTATAPSSGKFALYAIDPTTGDYDANTTANGWGYWMDENGDVISYGDDCAYFMEYTETSGLFTFGQYPSALSTGNTSSLKFALAYTNTSGTTTYVNFIFNCTIASTTSTKYSYTIATASGSPTGAGFTTTLTKNSTFNNYESSTEITSSNVSSYVTPTAVSGYTTSLSVSGSEIKVTYTKTTTTTYTYTIKTATGSPTGAGFTAASSLTSIGNNQYTTTTQITSSNVANYVTATAVEDYTATVSISGTTITVTYTVNPDITYTISCASGSPTGAGFTTTNLTSAGNNQYTTKKTITSDNVSSYVTATAVSGYTTSITVSGTTITITYTENTGTPATGTVTSFTATSSNTVSNSVTLTAGDATKNSSTITLNTSTLATYFNNQTSWTSNFKGYSTSLSTGGYYTYYYGANSAAVSGLVAQAPVTGTNTYTFYYNKNGQLLSSSDGAAFTVVLNSSTWTYTVSVADGVANGDYTLYTAMRCYYKKRSTSTATNYMAYFQFNVKVTTGPTNPTFTLASTAQSLEVGDTYTISLTTNSDGAKTYTSSNTSVATVDSNGKVTAVGAGTATITVSTAATDTYNAASGTVTITSTLKTQTVTLANTSATVKVGETTTNAVTVQGGATVTYSSSNTGVATIASDGTITGVKEGTATITVTVAATSAYAATTKTYTVTVSKGAQTLSFANSTLSVEMFRDATNAATTTGDGAITYAISDESIATIDASTGKVSGLTCGTATVTATAAATTAYGAATATYTLTVVPNDSLNTELQRLVTLGKGLYTEDEVSDAKSAGSSTTSTDGLITSSSQFSSPYTETSEGSFDYLLDGDGSTFWHSVWSSGSVDAGTHYFVVALNAAEQDSILLSMTRRSSVSDDHVTQFEVYGSNDNSTWTDITTLDFNLGSNTETVTSRFALGASYTYLKFVCTNTGSLGTTSCRGYFHMGEFQLYRITTTAATELDEALVTFDDVADAKEAVTAATPTDISQMKQAIHDFLGDGDINGDRMKSISDLTHLINIVKGTETDVYGTGDMNSDKTVDINDIPRLKNLIVGKGNVDD